MRETLTIGVIGVKRIGKSNETLRLLVEEYTKQTERKKARKALLIDINNEYGKYKIFSQTPPPGHQLYKDSSGGIYYIHPIRRIAIKDITLFSAIPKVEIRRVVPTINDDGSFATEEQLVDNIFNVFQSFRGGALMIEDFNVIFGDSLPKKIAGLLTNNGHRDVDLIYSIQSAGRMLPKLLQNTNIVRFHHQLDSIDESKEKLKAHYEIFKIAQILVDKQYYNDNKRFFVNVDRDNFKIKGKYSQKMLMDAIHEYVMETPSITKKYERRRDESGKKAFTYEQAVSIVKKDLFEKYFGNK